MDAQKNFLELIKVLGYIILFSLPWLLVLAPTFLFTSACAFSSGGKAYFVCTIAYLTLPVAFIFLITSIKMGWLKVMNAASYPGTKRVYVRYSILFIPIIMISYLLNFLS